jgi:integrase/recombinase XerC
MEQSLHISNAEIMERFLSHITSERRYSLLTVRNYRHDIEEFVRWGEGNSADGEFSLLKAQAEDMREWIMYLSDERRMKASSVNRSVASLRSLYRYLRRMEIVDRDIFALIPSLRTPYRLPKFVPEGDMIGVVDHILNLLHEGEWRQRRDAMMVLLLYSCGIRLAELAGINDEDFENNFTTLRVRGKGDKERLVPLTNRVQREVEHFVNQKFPPDICKNQEKALFLSKQAERISRSDVQRSVARLLRECGVEGKCSPHVLRHTFATHLLNDGADMREIQELMGHASLSSTQVYTHNNIAQLQRAYFAAHPRSKGLD